MSCELCETEVGVTSHTSKYYVPRSILEKERERSRQLIGTIAVYLKYIPSDRLVSKISQAIAEYEKSRGERE